MGTTLKPICGRNYNLKIMNTYIFVLSTSVLSIAAFSYHEALEILVQAVGIDAAADYLFSEINLSVNN